MRYATAVLASVTAAAMAVAGGAPATAAQPGTAEPTSMWVWSAGPPAELVDFATAAGIDRLYVFVTGSPDRAEKKRLRRLGERASDAGIDLWALAGEPRWALHQREALRWQRTALDLDVFVGTHLDVEPHALPAWDSDRDRVVRGYLDLLDRAQAASPLPLHVDVPFWYGTIPFGPQTLADAVLERVDGVTVMSYRDTATGPNSLWAVAEDMLVRGDGAGTPVELAVETNPLPDCPHCTFAEEGAAAMYEVVATVDALASDHPSYAGFAVHDYDGFCALSP